MNIRVEKVFLCITAFLSASFATSSSAAIGKLPSSLNSLMSSSIFSLSSGPVWARAGENQVIKYPLEFDKNYVANKETKTIADTELFFGLSRFMGKRFEGQLGAAVATTSYTRLSGVIWDFNDADFDNYKYSYKLRHSHLALKGKLLTESWYSVKPWISGSFGLGLNQSTHYTEQATIPEALVLANGNFPQNMTTAFTYTLGAGLQRTISENFQLGLGYEFADWGKSELKRAAAQNGVGKGLNLNHLYTNGLLLSLTWHP